LTRQSRSQHTSEPSASSVLFLLSGEQTGLPEAEARALVLMLDPNATFSRPEGRVLIARTAADPSEIESRVAFSRRVGRLVPDEGLAKSHLSDLREGTYAVNVIRTGQRRDSNEFLLRLAEEVGGRVSLDDPDRELTVVRGERDYLVITHPRRMKQGWVVRRPRARAYFHPAAIFPKLSRFLVNLSRVRRGEVFLDPFCGTGSLLIEAFEVGARPLGLDLASKMARGALRNRDKFGEEWLGVVRADVKYMPVRRADGIATDIPYGRASSTAGSSSREILGVLLSRASEALEKDRRLVVMHPKTVEVGKRGEFELEEEHHLYIHRKLTRTISVLRRV
jgi:putative methyltransferase (TIGR01177 family)